MHVPCLAHTIQLCIHDGISSVTEVQCREIIDLFNHSGIMTETMKGNQIQNNKPVRKLIQDVSTRWNSSYYMMKRIVKEEQALTVALGSLSNKKRLALNSNDYVTMRLLIAIMSPFEEATMLVSGEKYETVSVAHPLVEHLVPVCNFNNHDDNDNTQENFTSSDYSDKEHSDTNNF